MTTKAMNSPRKMRWKGTRWMIVSPYQEFEFTLSRQRKGAWSLFKYRVLKDVEKYKRMGWKAVKVEASFRVMP